MQLITIGNKEDKTKASYASPECQQLIDAMNDFYPKVGFHPPWVGYFVFWEGQVVGTGGFTGKPQDGKVEIAYWTFQAFTGKGIASFACQELIKIAHRVDPSLTITAKTAPEENASTTILRKHGFTFVKVVQDEEIGDAWLWLLPPLR